MSKSIYHFIFYRHSKIEAKNADDAAKDLSQPTLIHVAFVNFQQVGGAKIQAVTGRPTICRVKSLDP